MFNVFLALAGIAGLAIVAAVFAWPEETDADIVHAHPELALDHPRLFGADDHVHAPPIVIDALHPAWP